MYKKSAVICLVLMFCVVMCSKNPASSNNPAATNTPSNTNPVVTADSTQDTYGTQGTNYSPGGSTYLATDPIPVPVSPYVDGGEIAAVGSDPVESGFAQRIELYGKEQYFWGDPGTGVSIPLVKIVTSATADVVDAGIIFNPDFVDLSYGTGSQGWSPRRGHTWNDLVGSDHVEVAFINGNGDTVLQCKLDLISATTLVPSGYASLGIDGDGELLKGNASDILSFGTSLDDNINVLGWNDFVNSPSTDSAYTPNATTPGYLFFAIYRISIDPDAFGPSGFASVSMTYVHASPAKTPQETISVTEGSAPAPGSYDPWAPMNNSVPQPEPEEIDL